MSEKDDGGRENSVEDHSSRKLDVLDSRVGLGFSSPPLDGLAPLGCQCKVIGGKSLLWAKVAQASLDGRSTSV